MLKIVFEHSAKLPIAGYGGTERLIFWKMKELARRGFHISYIGHPESQLEDFGIHLIPRKEKGDWRSLIPKGTDLVHLTGTPHEPLDCPVIVTIHGNGQTGEVFHKNSVFLSKKHAAHHESLSYVYNGIDLEEYPYPTEKKWGAWKKFLFLAKAKWKVKNVKDCVKACKKTKKELFIAGGRVFSLSRKIHSYGVVDQKKKLELLHATDALLNPVRWHEPFGISMLESFAMGIPVIGSTYGSLPEVISNETGILCENYDQFLSVLQNPDSFRKFNPHTIRSSIENHFTIQKTIDAYLPLYEKVLRGESLNTTAPKTLAGFHAQNLLPF